MADLTREQVERVVANRESLAGANLIGAKLVEAKLRVVGRLYGARNPSTLRAFKCG